MADRHDIYNTNLCPEVVSKLTPEQEKFIEQKLESAAQRAADVGLYSVPAEPVDELTYEALKKLADKYRMALVKPTYEIPFWVSRIDPPQGEMKLIILKHRQVGLTQDFVFDPNRLVI